MVVNAPPAEQSRAENTRVRRKAHTSEYGAYLAFVQSLEAHLCSTYEYVKYLIVYFVRFYRPRLAAFGKLARDSPRRFMPYVIGGCQRPEP